MRKRAILASHAVEKREIVRVLGMMIPKPSADSKKWSTRKLLSGTLLSVAY